MHRCILALFFAAHVCGAAPPAVACDLALKFSLDPAQVVPPSSSAGSGVADLSLCFYLRGSISLNLTDVVTSVHLHGPAAPGENGPVLFNLPLPVAGLVHVNINGIPPEIQSLLATDAAYVDVHTVAHPNGAIRGVFRWEGTGVTPSSWTAVKALFR